MLNLKDICRHFGRQRTHDVLASINLHQDLPLHARPIVEDLLYIGLANETRDGLELTSSGAAALRSLDDEFVSATLAA